MRAMGVHDVLISLGEVGLELSGRGDVVSARAVETGLLHDRSLRGGGHHRVPVHGRQAGLAQTCVYLRKRRARRLGSTKLFHKLLGFKDAEEKSAVHPPIVRLAEVMLDAVVHGADEIARGVLRVEQDGSRFSELRPELVPSVVVGPHQGKLQPLAIRRVQKTFLQRLLHVLDAAVPIPVVHENGDPVIGGKVDFPRGPPGVAFIETAPQRFLRLLVSGKPRDGRFHFVPFRPPFAFPCAAEVVAVPVRVINRDDFRSFRGVVFSRCAQAGKRENCHCNNEVSFHSYQEISIEPLISAIWR